MGAWNPAKLAWVAPVVLGVGNFPLLVADADGAEGADSAAAGLVGGSGIFPTLVGSSAQHAASSNNKAK